MAESDVCGREPVFGGVVVGGYEEPWLDRLPGQERELEARPGTELELAFQRLAEGTGHGCRRHHVADTAFFRIVPNCLRPARRATPQRLTCFRPVLILQTVT